MPDNKENQALEQLIALVDKVLHGDIDKVDDISMMADDAALSPQLQRLSEIIARLSLKNEVREFRLEVMVEDLLNAQAALIEANMDPLTGLPNRAVFHQKLNEACEKATEKQRSLALLFIDLDRFKQINDTMGHDTGDELLQQVTARTQHAIREHDILARLGGDEFTVIMPIHHQNEEAEGVATRLVELLSSPFNLKAGTANIGSSIGISYFPGESATPTELIKNADVAMYTAKESGRNRYILYHQRRN